MAINIIPFTIKKMGYDPEMVDKYFQKVADEYDSLEQRFTELSRKYDEMMKQSANKTDAIAKALVNAETHAMKVVAEAETEAAKIINSARQEVTAMQEEKASAVAEINNVVKQLKLIVSVN